ncbi:MAG: hypothetical protein KGQ66_20535 [Acidobacteriota bacterium]|nr:hypothetical protein [Acidobacteriota bacterium]
MNGDTTDPIEPYLDELLLQIRLPPRDTRRLMAEIEAHLLESAACLPELGRSDSEAAREAVRRIGTPGEVAAAA